VSVGHAIQIRYVARLCGQFDVALRDVERVAEIVADDARELVEPSGLLGEFRPRLLHPNVVATDEEAESRAVGDEHRADEAPVLRNHALGELVPDLQQRQEEGGDRAGATPADEAPRRHATPLPAVDPEADGDDAEGHGER